MENGYTEEIDRLRAALELIADREKCPPFGDDPAFNCVKDKINCADCMARFAKMTLGQIHQAVDELLRGKL